MIALWPGGRITSDRMTPPRTVDEDRAELHRLHERARLRNVLRPERMTSAERVNAIVEICMKFGKAPAEVEM